jgi:hypothetical protein
MMTDRFAIVPILDGQPVPPEAIVIGPLSEVMEYISQSIAREAAEQRLADRELQTAEAANRVVDVGAHLMDQVEALAAQKEAEVRADRKRRADKARRDAENAAREREAQAQAYLDQQGSDQPTPHGGELSSLGPVEHERYAPYDQGDLPRELVAKVPADPGNYVEPDPEELGGPLDPHQIAQPISVSLNEATP